MLLCAIPSVIPGGDSLELVYTDPDGDKVRSRVLVELFKVSDLGTEAESILAIDSNDASQTGPNRLSAAVSEDFSTELFTGSYYARILLRSKFASQDPEFRALRILSED